MKQVTSKHGLIYVDGEMLPVPPADWLAQKFGHMCAERLVEDIEKNGPKELHETDASESS